MMIETRAERRGQRGEGKIGAIIALLLVALVVHVGMKIIPHKVQTGEFEKHIENQLLNLAANLQGADEFLLSIVDKATALELPVREDTIELKLVGATWQFHVEYDINLKMIWGDWNQTVDIRRQRTKL